MWVSLSKQALNTQSEGSKADQSPRTAAQLAAGGTSFLLILNAYCIASLTRIGNHDSSYRLRARASIENLKVPKVALGLPSYHCFGCR